MHPDTLTKMAMAMIVGLQAWTLTSVNSLQIEVAVVQTKLAMLERGQRINQKGITEHEMDFEQLGRTEHLGGLGNYSGRGG